MDAKLKTRLAIKIVEATISEMSGHFRKAHNLKRFYRELQKGASRAFIIFRKDKEDFVGLLVTDKGLHLNAQLWVNLDNRENGLSWVQTLEEQFQTTKIEFCHRSPQDPIAQARSMGIINR